MHVKRIPGRRSPVRRKTAPRPDRFHEATPISVQWAPHPSHVKRISQRAPSPPTAFTATPRPSHLWSVGPSHRLRLSCPHPFSRETDPRPETPARRKTSPRPDRLHAPTSVHPWIGSQQTTRLRPALGGLAPHPSPVKRPTRRGPPRARPPPSRARRGPAAQPREATTTRSGKRGGRSLNQTPPPSAARPPCRFPSG